MQDFFNSFTDGENVIIIGLVFMVIILLMVIFILDIKNKFKKDSFDDELLDISFDNSDIVDDSTGEIKEIKYVEESKELEKTKAKIELENLKEELKKEKEQELVEEINNINPSVEESNSFTQDNNQINETKDFTNIDNNSVNVVSMEDIINKSFNDEEENAIISVSELEKKADSLYNSEEVRLHEDDSDVPISITELEALYNNDGINEDNKLSIKEDFKSNIKMDEVFDLNTKKDKDNHFSSSPIISPVYGINEEDNNSLDNINLEQTANLDKLNEELKKVNEFLSMLKELRNKLQ